MRISTNQQFNMYLSQIQSAHSRYLDAQLKVMTGKKFQYASEAPSDAQFVISASALKSRVQQLDDNLRSANDYLKNTESVFSELNTAMNHAYTLGINGANSSYTQDARDGMAKEIQEVQKRLVYLSNTQGASGEYIFAGQKTDTKPFTENPPTLTYNGDDNPINVEVRPGETLRVNLQTPGTSFSQMYDALENLKNDLLSGDVSKLGNQDIQAIQDQIKAISSIRGDVGTKLQTVTNLQTQNQRRMDDLTQQISDVQDVDMAEAVTTMQMAETSYTAALQVTARGQGLSLMDYLR